MTNFHDLVKSMFSNNVFMQSHNQGFTTLAFSDTYQLKSYRRVKLIRQVCSCPFVQSSIFWPLTSWRAWILVQSANRKQQSQTKRMLAVANCIASCVEFSVLLQEGLHWAYRPLLKGKAKRTCVIAQRAAAPGHLAVRIRDCSCTPFFAGTEALQPYAEETAREIAEPFYINTRVAEASTIGEKNINRNIFRAR